MGLRDSTVSSWVASAAIFCVAAFSKGDWILFAVQIAKCILPEHNDVFPSPLNTTENITLSETPLIYFKDLQFYMITSVLASVISYLGFCSFLQYWFYIRQADKDTEWKCQPGRYLTWDNHVHEILLGTANIMIGGVFSALIACYLANGGPSMMYFRLDEYGYVYLALSGPILFIIGDAFAYYMHRYEHTPWVYKHIHKMHHRYASPTAYSVVAMHPLEFMSYQFMLALPIWYLPCHPAVFITVVLYNYYYGVIDHSGIYMKALWPWQPDSKFHDDHHRYFHVNFGFNTPFWDNMHGTMRKKNRKYGEAIFGGFGKED